ncbi:hypothetical protein YB2330_003483 [Saitoella coloradoensis]
MSLPSRFVDRLTSESASGTGSTPLDERKAREDREYRLKQMALLHEQHDYHSPSTTTSSTSTAQKFESAVGEQEGGGLEVPQGTQQRTRRKSLLDLAGFDAKKE